MFKYLYILLNQLFSLLPPVRGMEVQQVNCLLLNYFVKLRFKAWTIVKPFVLHYGKLLKIKMVMTLAPDSIKSPRH